MFFAAKVVKMLRHIYCFEWGRVMAAIFTDLEYGEKKAGWYNASLVGSITTEINRDLSPFG